MKEDYTESLNFTIKTIVFNEDPAFGKGVAQIMNLVKETGRLSSAYKIMGLSSSKGWKIIKRAEKDLGFQLFNTIVGGKNGGNSSLSVEGAEFLNRYNSFIDELDKTSKKLFIKHFYD